MPKGATPVSVTANAMAAAKLGLFTLSAGQYNCTCSKEPCLSRGAWSHVLGNGESRTPAPLFAAQVRSQTRRESEWARGVATADGGNAPPGQGQEVSPPPPSRPHTTTPSPHHISTTHTTLAASLLLVAFTVRVL